MEAAAHISFLGHLMRSTYTVDRLLMACALGGAVGFEREWRHKDSGLRTNMLICMGSALFTVMSAELAGPLTPDKSRVASNIVQGIGFLGAGLILHTKNRILGLTSAATVFVVAAVGMTCGAGLYLEALFATVLLLLALQTVGTVETRLGRKRFPMVYEVRAEAGLMLGDLSDAEVSQAAATRDAALHRMLTAILKVLDAASLRLQIQDRDNVAGMERISFSIMATRKMHARILAELRASDATDQVIVFRDRQDD